MFKLLLILGGVVMGSLGQAQTCAMRDKLEGIYRATCQGFMTMADGQTLPLSKDTFEIMQSPSDACKLLIGVILSAEDQIPYFRVGEFAEYSGTHNYFNFADYDSVAGSLNTFQIRKRTNGQTVEAGHMQFNDSKPVKYWSKSKGPRSSTMSFSCEIREWFSKLPFRPG